MTGNKCGAVVFIMTFLTQPMRMGLWGKLVKEFVVTTASKGLPEWFQIFVQRIIAEFLLLLHPWVAKAISQLHFLIGYVIDSLCSVSLCLNYCSQNTPSRICNCLYYDAWKMGFYPNSMSCPLLFWIKEPQDVSLLFWNHLICKSE